MNTVLPELITIQEASRRLKVSEKTLRRWEKGGLISAIRTMGGHRRFDKAIVEAMAKKSQDPARRVSSMLVPAHTDNTSLYRRLHVDQKKVIGYSLGILFFGMVGTIAVKGETTSKIQNITKENIAKVLAAQTTNLNPTFNVNIPAIFKDVAQFAKDVTVNGQTTTVNDLVVKGNLNLPGNLTIPGDLAVNGGTTLNNLTVKGAQTVSSLTDSGALTVSGASAFSGNITKINGVTTFFPSSQGSSGTILTNNGSGTLTWGTISASGITADSLDFTEFIDSMTLDANLTLAQAAFTWAQTFTGTTGPGLSYTASGAVASGNAAAYDIQVTNASTSVPAVMISNAGSTYALRVNDDGTTTDSTPFVIDATGQVGIGVTAPNTLLTLAGNSKLTFAASSAQVIDWSIGSNSSDNLSITDGSGAHGFGEGKLITIGSSANNRQIIISAVGVDIQSGIGGLSLGTNANPVYQLDVTGAIKGKALAAFNETGDQNILTASASGTTELNVAGNGNLLINGVYTGLSGTNTRLQATGTGVGSTGSGSVYFLDSSGVTKARVDTTATGLDLGDGSDGALSVSSGTTTINDDSAAAYGLEPIAASTTAASGQTIISVASTTNLVAGDELLVIQMQGAGAGSYEFRKISSITANTSVTLTENLTHTFTEDATSSAQLVEVPQFTSVSITGSGKVVPPAWNGSIGGILIFRATGTVNLNTSALALDASALGFRGGTASTGNTGQQGENIKLSQANSTSASYDGGGGGGSNASNGGGGGGGGGMFANGDGTAAGGAAGGRGRGIIPFDGSKIYFGGGGGAGGDDTTTAGSQGGNGGAGGGIIYIAANQIVAVPANDQISVDGSNGSNATSNGGGGGGGGSGVLWMQANKVDLQDSAGGNISATTSTAGTAGGGSGGAGGAGAIGLIKIQTQDLTGSFNSSQTNSARFNLAPGLTNYGSLNIGKVDTEAADLAEYYQSEDALEPGDIVTTADTVTDTSIDSRFAVKKYVQGSGKPILGAVSTKPGLTLGSSEINNLYHAFPIALKGRTPVNVVNSAGPIHKGDAISPSSVSGYGQKATSGEMIVGYALEEFDPAIRAGAPCLTNSELECGSVMAFISTTYWSLTPSGDLTNSVTQSDTITQLSNEPINLSVASSDEANQIASMSAEIASIKDRLSSLETANLNATGSAVLGISTDSATLNNLTVLKNTVLSNTVVNGKLNIGTLTFDNANSSIDSIGKLKIQSLALDDIQFQNDSIEMDKTGNLIIKKGVIIGNDNIRGSETIHSGDTQIQITKTWTAPPVSITANATWDSYVWVDNITMDGFTIHVKNPPSNDSSVFWSAMW